jgi:glycosyltransferase involved in cell wall biosynthesis
MAAKSACTWHLITSEYPPQSGGVSDYTYLVAHGLASAKDKVHVWCPTYLEESPQIPGVDVHRVMGRFAPIDLCNAGRELNRFQQPRRLLVQWVPHGYGYKSLNVHFCLWLWQRFVCCGDKIDLMVHEPFLPFNKHSYRQSAAAAVHRLMTIILLRIAGRVWISTPTWRQFLLPYAMGRNIRFDWLPLTSNVPITNDEAAVSSIRAQYARGGVLLGHFGTFGPPIAPLVNAILPSLLRQMTNASVLLIGSGSGEFGSHLIQKCPDLRDRIHATGHVDAPSDLSPYISACHVLLQPYPDGITSRRTTIIAALSHGRPIVTTSGMLTESFWEASGAVVMVPAGDVDAFVTAVLEVLNNPSQSASMGKSALDLYHRQFQLDHIIGLLRENTAVC